ncbi:MAG TPA: hypothetical protein PKB14_02520 [Rubrivivax sp.]|nr:hypothetical protein [Rubrivivax sp.]
MKKLLMLLFTVLPAVGWQWLNTLKRAGTRQELCRQSVCRLLR